MLEVGKLVVTPPTLQGVWGRGGGGDPPYPRRCAGGGGDLPYPRRCMGGGGGGDPPYPRRCQGGGEVVVTPLP